MEDAHSFVTAKLCMSVSFTAALHATRVAAIGIVLGGIGAWNAARWLESLVFGVKVHSLPMMVSAGAAVGLGFNPPMPKPVLFGLRGLQNEENVVAAPLHLTPICRGKWRSLGEDI